MLNIKSYKVLQVLWHVSYRQDHTKLIIKSKSLHSCFKNRAAVHLFTFVVEKRVCNNFHREHFFWRTSSYTSWYELNVFRKKQGFRYRKHFRHSVLPAVYLSFRFRAGGTEPVPILIPIPNGKIPNCFGIFIFCYKQRYIYNNYRWPVEHIISMGWKDQGAHWR